MQRTTTGEMPDPEPTPKAWYRDELQLIKAPPETAKAASPKNCTRLPERLENWKDDDDQDRTEALKDAVLTARVQRIEL